MNTSSDDKALVVDGCTVRVVDADRVTAVAERMPLAADLVDTADVFGLLSDPNRLRLPLALLAGELCGRSRGGRDDRPGTAVSAATHG